MRTDSAHMLHLPRARVIAVSAAGQSADGADVDAHATLVALEVIALVGRDLRNHAAVDHAQRAHAHAFTADTHAAIAQNATRIIEEHHRGPLLLVHVNLHLREAALARAIAEGHVLQFALTALVAHRAIQRMVGQQELQHGFARRYYLRRFRAHHHA